MGDLIGVFGGTFDPPHIGHCILAEEAQQRLGLHRVLWIPVGEPPHKPNWPITAVDMRLRMVDTITRDHESFELSRVDVDRPGPHFAKDTLQILHEQQPGARFTYLMGADSLRDLGKWQDPEIFVERTHAIGVLQRPWVEYDLTAIEDRIPGVTHKLEFIPAPLIDISGQVIRQRRQAGLPVRYMLTPEVYQIIQQHELYL